MHPSPALHQQPSLLDSYIQFRFDQIKAKSGTIDLDTIKQNDVIFLDPTRHLNSHATIDQFREIKGKLDTLAGGSYKPSKPQQFFSFINDYGCHWNLYLRTINTNGTISEKKIECKGDGACGIHAIVEAVFNSDNLRKNPLIKDNLPLLQNPLLQKSSKPVDAINFVLAIFEDYQKKGNTANTTTTGRIAALENLKIERGDINSWATSDDFAIFADAVGILLLNSNLITREERQNPDTQFKEQIILNILQRDDEKNEFFEEFKKRNSSQSNDNFDELYSEAFNRRFPGQTSSQGITHEALRTETVTRLNQQEKESK